ncbi:MAG: cytochrome P450 [Actinomycetota bacterium]
MAGPGHPETVDEVDVYSPEAIENWYPTYDLLQRECPVYHVPGTRTFFLTRYDEIYHVLRRTDLFRRGDGGARPTLTDPEARAMFERDGWPKALPLGVNPPEHRRWRDLIDHFFTVAGAQEQRTLITDTANELIDAFIDDGRVEFMEAFARPLPSRVITTMMGFPLSDLEQLRIWSEAWVAPYSLQLDPQAQREAVALMVEFQHYIAEHIADRRARPRDDIITHLATTTVELPTETRQLTDGEIINIVDHLFIGGNETTTFALTSGMWLIVQHPEMQQRLHDTPGDARRWVDEVLRLESPTQGMDRHTAEDTELCGVEIPRGSHVHIRYAAANRDPAQFDCPTDLDIDRTNSHRHFAFSIGESHCPGAGLTRLEQTIAWQELMRRIANVRFMADRNTFHHSVNFTLRAFEGLHIEFDKR